MGTRQASRREFLARAAAGAGAVASAGLAGEAAAGSQEQHTDPGAPAAAQPRSDGHEHRAFFNDGDAATMAAFTERLMPGAPGKPGAREADVLNYIDLALAGAYADLQDFYRRGLAQLEEHCRQIYNESFVRLATARQDDVIRTLEEGKAAKFTWPTAQEFFNTIRTHTMEGMFADPIYGGNKEFAGWRLVGFPGAQPVFTPADMQSRQAFTRAPVIGLQVQLKKT
jgi:gluconate 2-dehydrogenase gamma chain